MFGVDYAWGYEPHVPKALLAKDVKFVCRYLSTPGNKKNLGKDESLALRRAGLKIVTVFETTARRALSGHGGGVEDAQAANVQLNVLGAPKDAPVYFAVDFDATLRQQTLINAYLVGAGSVLGLNRVGVYGGYYVVKRALDAKVCKYAWQTYAWSGGQWDERVQIRQVKNGMRLAGLDVDFNQSRAADFGQWFNTPSNPKPVKPVVFPQDDRFWTWVRWRDGIGEFAGYGQRNADVRPNLPEAISRSWWDALAYFHAKRPDAV